MIKDLEEILKKRHLTRDERRALYSPPNDYISGKNGDTFVHSTVVEVDDVIQKYT